MNETKFVKPIDGLMVRDPVTREPLPAEGREVPWKGREGVYWKRRVADGTVTIVDQTKKPEAPAPVKVEESSDTGATGFPKGGKKN